MASRTEMGLADAWRGLSGNAADEGWRLITLGRIGPCTLRAGRRFPGDVEALLASFPGVRLPSVRQLPHGRGFDVSRVEQTPGDDEGITIALTREPAGSLDLFETMSEDVIGTLRRSGHGGVEHLLELFLRRVAAWQDFMRRPGDQHLSSEQEVGLYGELLVLEQMIDSGAAELDIVEAWEGPLDGLQDFVIGAGAIEVKTSVATSGFPARIGSLEQLDNAFRQPLYLAAQRLLLGAGGVTLPVLVERLRARLADGGTAGLFERRLQQAGYDDAHSEHYVRSFASAGERLFLVSERFPRLTPGNVAAGIRSAVYTIDVDQIDSEPVPLADALRTLEII